MENNKENPDLDNRSRLEKSQILYKEYVSRRDSGEEIDTEEFVRMFPEYEKELRNLFEKVGGKTASDWDHLSDFLKSDDSDKSSKIVGDFRIIREIGSGGMATVFEAEQISLKRKVALKVLPAYLSISDKAVERFEREALAGSRQKHPGIVTVYMRGQHQNMRFIAQELVNNGFNLSDRLAEVKKSKEPPVGYYRETAKMIRAVAEALDHAHQSSVIHRDIKPSNILLDKNNNPMVTDFGLAKIEDVLSMSQTNDSCGTPYYMSPEQTVSSHKGIDLRTDIYSLGVTLYECLTLKVPFKGESPTEILKRVILKEAEDPRKLNPKVPADLEVICLKAMEKEPARRYQTMKELADDLDRYIHGEVILAKPTGLGTRFFKKIKRNPLVSLAGGLLVLTLFIFVIYILWSYPQIRKERDRVLYIKQVFENVLMAPVPEREGDKVTMIEAIDLAIIKLDKERVPDPRIEAEIRNTFGRVYQGLGAYEKAVIQHRKALKRCEQDLGAEHSDTMRSRNDLGCALLFIGTEESLKEAESHFMIVSNYFEENLGLENPETLKAKGNFAAALTKLGQSETAESIYRKIIPFQESVLGSLHPDTLTSYNNLGVLLCKPERCANAFDYLKKAYNGRITVLGGDIPDTLRSGYNLARCHAILKQYDAAEKLLQDVYAKLKLKLRRGHGETLEAAEELIDLLYTHLKKNEEAILIIDEVLPVYEEMDSLEGNRMIAGYILRKCYALCILRKKSSIEIEFNKGVKFVRDKLPRLDESRLKLLRGFGDYLCGLKKDYKRGEEVFLEIYESYKELNGEEDKTTQAIIKKLVSIFKKQEDKENEALFRKRLM